MPKFYPMPIPNSNPDSDADSTRCRFLLIINSFFPKSIAFKKMIIPNFLKTTPKVNSDKNDSQVLTVKKINVRM